MFFINIFLVQANKWDAAHKLASSYMREGEVRVLYMDQAQKMEAVGSLLEAEKLYVQVGEVTHANSQEVSLMFCTRRLDGIAAAEKQEVL